MILGIGIFSAWAILVSGTEPLDDSAQIILDRAVDRLNYQSDWAVVDLGLKQAEKLNLKYDLSDVIPLGESLFSVIENASLSDDLHTRSGNLLGNAQLMKHEVLVDRALIQLTPTQVEVPPAAPSAFAVTAATLNSLTLSWTSNGGSTARFYLKYAEGSVAPETCEPPDVVIPLTESSIVVGSLIPATEYSFSICAMSSTSMSSSGAVLTSVWTTSEDVVLAPISQTETSISLAWRAVEGAVGYKVVRADGSQPPIDCQSGEIVFEGPELVIVDEGLTQTTEYSYRVCSKNALGEFSVGATITAFTNPQPPPPEPDPGIRDEDPPPTYEWRFKPGADATTAAVVMNVRAAKIPPSIRIIELMKLYDRYDESLKTIGQITADPGVCDFLIQKAESQQKMDLILGLDRLRAADLGAVYLQKILDDKTSFDERPQQVLITVETVTHFATLDVFLLILEKAPGEDSTKLAESLIKTFTREVFDRDPRTTSYALQVSNAIGLRSDHIKSDYSYPKPKREELSNRLKSAKSSLDRLWSEDPSQ